MRAPKAHRGHLAAAAGVLLFAAACGSSTTDAGTTTDAGSAPEDTSSAPGAVVGTREIDGMGTVLVDKDGMTLYTSDAEASGTIKCVDSCTDFWPPLTADDLAKDSVDGVSGKLGLLTRPDDSKQVTLDGHPLYTFAEDRTPGSVRGDGFEDDFQGTHFLWSAVKIDDSGAPATTTPPAEDRGSGGDDGGDDGGYDYGY